MSKPIKLKKGDRVLCTHYKKPVIWKVSSIGSDGEIWVTDPEIGRECWWGHRNWLRKLPKKK